MGQLNYVCISDLHLGAAYSVLTDIDPDGKVNPTDPSPTLREFAASLRAFLPEICGDRPPKLILLGDVLDLAFSPTQVAIRTYVEFVRALFPKGGPQLFDSEILYLPGNHDHREWQVVRDELLLDSLDNLDTAAPQAPPVCTRLFADPHIECRLLTALTRSIPHLEHHVVRVAYPNLGWKKNGRLVVLHHGHFVESMYRAVSEFEHWLDPGEALSDDVNVIESKNGPWIDFLWSTTGDEDRAGKDVIRLFEIMQDAGATRDAIKQVSNRIADSLKLVTVGPSSHWSYKSYEISPSGLIRGALDYLIGKGTQAERLAFETVLSDSTVQSLRWYLSGPVYRQVTGHSFDPRAETPDTIELPTTFIFGHTHKPFEDRLVVKGYKRPVDIVNTGGWVLDSPGMSPTQGASLAFIDDEGHTAMLRLFNDDPNPTVKLGVRARGAGGPSDEQNPMLTSLQAALQNRQDIWTSFQEAFRTAADLRGRITRDRFFDPFGDPPVSRVDTSITQPAGSSASSQNETQEAQV